MENYLELTDKVVKRCCETMELVKGFFTTLDVKISLRERGYWAEQAEISRIINSFSVEAELFQDWEKYSDEPFNIYRFVYKDSNPVTTTTTVADVEPEEEKPEETDRPSSCDWLLFDSRGVVHKKMFVKSNVSRNSARYYFSTQYNVPYIFCGCSRAKV